MQHAFLSPEQVSSIIKLEPYMENAYFPVALDAGAESIHLDYLFWDGSPPVRITLDTIAVFDWIDGNKGYSKASRSEDWLARNGSPLEKQLRAVLEA